MRYRVISDDLVRVTVHTAKGNVASKKLRTTYWPRGHWYGAARIDGRPGAELVIGTTAGAHTLFYSVLTWRHGDLLREGAPGREREWAVDAAYNIYLGWLRTRSDGHVRMTERLVTRDGTGHHWSGTAKEYTWRDGVGWKRSDTRRLSIQGDRNASRVAGWKVKGLKRGLL